MRELCASRHCHIRACDHRNFHLHCKSSDGIIHHGCCFYLAYPPEKAHQAHICKHHIGNFDAPHSHMANPSLGWKQSDSGFSTLSTMEDSMPLFLCLSDPVWIQGASASGRI